MSRQQQDVIESPGAWLTTVASRICLNCSARHGRGGEPTWANGSEPLPGRTEWISGPGRRCRPGRPGHPGRVGQHGLPRRARIDDPAQRVASILHDVFRYSSAEVAEIVGRTPAACRQLASSAARRIARRTLRESGSRAGPGIVRAFKAAWEAQDIDALIGLLDPDATAIADGGGLATTSCAASKAASIARAWVEIANRAPGNMTFLERTVNGQPGLVAQQDGVTVTVFAFDVAGDRVKHIWVVRNPEKLRPWTTG